MTPELQTDARLVIGSANGVPDGMRSLLARRGTDVLHSVRRRFVRVQGRDVHYLRVGVGPPVVLLHAAMSSARGLLPLLQRLATDHTVFAFDHPGMGDSAPLAKRDMQAADAADALKATLLALRMPRCPIYGSHTGAAVALELACRHPERVSALTMDGVTVFTPREKVFFLSEGYMPPFTVKNDGSHLQSAWVKARDHFVWFPWNTRLAKNRMPWPFASWRAVHDMFLEILRAGDAYRALYGAAFKLDGRRAVAALTVPTTIMSSANDPLLPHLKRLGRLKPNQRIRRYPSDPVAYLDATANLMRGHRVQAQAPVDALFRPSPGAINRRYIDLTGGQILMRSTAEALSGRPLLLLHEGRASSRVFEPLMRSLGRQRPIFAPDLPDNGASDPLARTRPRIRDYADAVQTTLAALRLDQCDIYALGAGAAVGLELLTRPAFARSRALLEAPDFYEPRFARRLSHEWAPVQTLQWDGSHLNRLWLMLRDENAFWPWFDKSPGGACAVDAPDDCEMHGRVADILRSLPTYHRLAAAALRFNWVPALRRVRKRPVRLATVTGDPRQPHVEMAARLARLPQVTVLSAAADKKAREILRLLRG